MGGDAKRGKKRKCAEDERLVIDQCALFAVRQAISAAKGREVSAAEILGVLHTAGEWAVACRHDARSRKEGRAVTAALYRGTGLPTITLGMMQKCSVELGTLIPRFSSVLMRALFASCMWTLMLYAQVSAW
jgi:hypothetical protein